MVQAESHIRTPEAAEAVLAAGQADMVSIVRGQIADPHLVAKARAGRADDVRPCISCNQLCWGRRSRDYWISCLVNPSAGREWEWGGDRFEPAADPRRVLVVGGGPAGLETARVAAERGHRVTLVERARRLGGQFRLAGLQPSRGQITDLLAWYGRRLEALGVDVRLGVEAHRRLASRESAPTRWSWRPGRGRPGPGSSGRGRWSTGSPAWTTRTSSPSRTCSTARPSRAGASSSSTTSATGAASGPPLHLAEPGHDVTILTAAPVVAGGLFHSAADGPLRQRFADAGGRSITGSTVLGWRPGAAAVVSTLTGELTKIEADTLVIAETPVAVTALADDLTAPRHRVPPGRRLRRAAAGQPRLLRGPGARRRL